MLLIPRVKPDDEIRLPRKPVGVDCPFPLFRSPAKLKLAQNLRNKFSHLHQRDILSNTRACPSTKLVREVTSDLYEQVPTRLVERWQLTKVKWE